MGTLIEEKPSLIKRIEFSAGSSLDVPISLLDGVKLSITGAKRIEGSEDALSLSVTRVDHLVRLIFDEPLEAKAVTMITLAGSSSVSSDRPRLFFAAPGEELDFARSIPFDFTYDEKVHRVVVPVEDSRLWTGKIASIAFRFIYTQGSLDQKPARLDLERVGFWRTESPLVRARFTAELMEEAVTSDLVELLPSVKISNEVRPALYAPAPSRYECRVTVPDHPFLDFDFGMLESSWNKPGDGMTFSVSVAPGSREDPERVWSLFVDPKSRPEDGRWHDARVDLSKFAGKEVSLFFETFPARPDDTNGNAEYDYGVWSNADLISIDPSKEPLPSVVVVCLDTLRADRLGCYGYDRNTSPFIDEFSKESVLFENAISQAPETLSAHMSFFTGLYPREHHVWHVEHLSDELPYLIEAFREQGYRTAAFTEDGGVAAVHGFDRAFQSYHDGALRGMRGEKLVEETFGLASRFVKRYRDRPFFVFVHTYETHTPYDPPPAEKEELVGKYDGPIAPPVSWAKMESLLLNMKNQPLTDADYGFVSELYDAGIRHVDQELRGLFEVLKENQIEDRCYRVVLSDHGEDFWDHFGFATHGHSLYEEMVRVPLLISGPGLEARRGTRVPDQVELLDVLPTLLSLLDFPYPESDVSGNNFAGLLHGDGQPHTPAFAEDHTLFERVMIRTKVDGVPYKLVHSPGMDESPIAAQIRGFIDLSRFHGILEEWELYCLGEDPKELRNIAADMPAILQELQDLLVQYKKDHPLGDAYGTAEITQELIDRLENLGYSDPRTEAQEPQEPDSGPEPENEGE